MFSTGFKLSRLLRGDSGTIRKRPGVAAALWTAFAPSLSGVTRVIAVGLAVASWLGHAPSVALPLVSKPSAGAASWAGPLPTVDGLEAPLDPFTPGGIVPAVTFDFVNDVYYVGDTEVALTDIMSGTVSRDSSGLTLNVTNIQAINGALDTFKLNGASCVAELTATQASYQGIVTFGTADAPLFKSNTAAAWNYLSSNTLATSANTKWGTNICRVVGTWSTTTRKICVNNTAIVSAATGPAQPTAVNIGHFNGSHANGGKLRKLVLFDSILSNRNMRVCSREMPWNEAHVSDHGISFATTQKVDLGTILSYEYTQPWSMLAWVNVFGSHGTEQVIFSNFSGTGPAYRGYEVFLKTVSSGVRQVKVRICSAFGSAIIDVEGATAIDDAKPRCILVTYSGNGLASGVKIFVDGVLETMTTIADTLGGGTTVNSSNFVVGNQKDFESQFYLNGTMHRFEMYSDVKDQTWATAYASSPFTLPPSGDSAQEVCLAFDDDSGTTVTDSSGNGRDGTLSSSSQWI